MKAVRNNEGNVVVTLTPDETHVLIWGGPADIVNGLDGMFRTMLIAIEDHDMSEREYQERFRNLDDLYDRLRPTVAFYLSKIGEAS